MSFSYGTLLSGRVRRAIQVVEFLFAALHVQQARQVLAGLHAFLDLRRRASMRSVGS